ncbi:hypothetical protein NKR23_g11124 [Pleurostoma richardsiae]|uniref:Uncharacterized protein n=1 Tax=Pleurostoma richardsiae TaxID=41990 RepID=A0AA38R8G8_9PEZI|nr:hypothetical protein NKR23_g11124 [Pleurostoma richardsiae]
MAPPQALIPRFLLPQTGMIWRRVNVPHSAPSRQLLHLTARWYAAGKSSKPPVLEKPAKFNPPSHGSRLPKRTTPRHYGGPLSAEEIQVQKKKDYPGLMAPEGTWAHWFWNNRAFHLFITLGSLTGLAIFTFVQNFKRNSPYADMLPAPSDFLSHPFLCTRQLLEVIRLTEAHQSAIVAEKRKQRVDDVVKRSEYRKAHGLEQEGFFGGWTAKTDAESLGPAIPVGDGTTPGIGGDEGKRKKWLGIF